MWRCEALNRTALLPGRVTLSTHDTWVYVLIVDRRVSRGNRRQGSTIHSPKFTWCCVLWVIIASTVTMAAGRLPPAPPPPPLDKVHPALEQRIPDSVQAIAIMASIIGLIAGYRIVNTTTTRKGIFHLQPPSRLSATTCCWIRVESTTTYNSSVPQTLISRTKRNSEMMSTNSTKVSAANLRAICLFCVAEKSSLIKASVRIRYCSIHCHWRVVYIQVIFHLVRFVLHLSGASIVVCSFCDVFGVNRDAGLHLIASPPMTVFVGQKKSSEMPTFLGSKQQASNNNLSQQNNSTSAPANSSIFVLAGNENA